MSNDQISINNLSKVFDNGFEALKNINLNIKKGEIFAMLGPNGAGKTTLISIICGIVRLSSGKVTVDDLFKFGCFFGCCKVNHRCHLSGKVCFLNQIEPAKAIFIFPIVVTVPAICSGLYEVTIYGRLKLATFQRNWVCFS